MVKFKKIDLKFIFYFLVAVIFVKPGYFEEFNLIDNIFNLLRFAFSILIILPYFKRGKVSKLFLGFCSFHFLLIFSTIVNFQDIVRAVMYMCVNLSIVVLIEESIRENNFIRIDALFISYSCMVIINFIGLLIFPEGLYLQAGDRGNFINIDNLLGHILLVSICLSLINIHNNKLRKISHITIIISILTIIITWSATAVTSVIVLIGIYLLKTKNSFLNKILNMKVLLVGFLLFFVLIATNASDSLIGDFVTNVLGKDMTFSGRTYIWEQFFNYINSGDINVMYGNGIRSSNQLYILHFDSYAHLHNQFYNILYEGGIFAILIFIYIIFKSSIKLASYNNKISIVLSSTLVAFLFFMTMEINRDLEYITFLLTYSYYIDKLCFNFEEQ